MNLYLEVVMRYTIENKLRLFKLFPIHTPCVTMRNKSFELMAMNYMFSRKLLVSTNVEQLNALF